MQQSLLLPFLLATLALFSFAQAWRFHIIPDSWTHANGFKCRRATDQEMIKHNPTPDNARLLHWQQGILTSPDFKGGFRIMHGVKEYWDKNVMIDNEGSDASKYSLLALNYSHGDGKYYLTDWYWLKRNDECIIQNLNLDDVWSGYFMNT